MKRLPPALLLLLSIAPSNHLWAQIQSYGGFGARVWFEDRPNFAGSPDDFSVWACYPGPDIRRYDSWTQEVVEEPLNAAVITHINGLGQRPVTLHDVSVHRRPASQDFGAISVGTEGLVLWEGTTEDKWREFVNVPDPSYTKEWWACAVDNTDGVLFADWFIAGDGPTLLTTTGVSSTWTVVNVPAPTGTRFLSMDFADWSLPGRAGLVGTDDGGIYHTTDGVSWSLGTINGYTSSLPLLIWDIDFRPGSTTEAIAVGGNAEGSGAGYAFRTTDGGMTWNAILPQCEAPPPAGCPIPNVQPLPGHPCNGVQGSLEGTKQYQSFATIYGVHMRANGSAFCTTYGGGVWRYRPRQQNWADVADTLNYAKGPLWGCHGNGSNRVWLSGQFGVLRQSSNGGNSFSSLSEETTWRLADVEFPTNETQNGWAVGQSSTIARTTDGGATWTEQHRFRGGPNLGPYLQRIAALDDQSACTVGDAISVPGGHQLACFATNNGGDSCGWQLVGIGGISASGNGLGSLAEVAAAGRNPVTQEAEFWVTGNPGLSWSGLARSIDGGTSWQQFNLPLSTFKGRGISFLNRDVAVLVGENQGAGSAWLTLNATAATPTWNPILTDVAAGPFRKVAVTLNHTYAITADAVFYYNRLSGEFEDTNWPPFLGSDLQDIESFETSSGNLTLVASDSGRLVERGSGWFKRFSGSDMTIRGISIPNISDAWITGQHTRWGDSKVVRVD